MSSGRKPSSMAKIVPAVRKVDVERAVQACIVATQAEQSARSADAEKNICMMAVLEPLLGIKAVEELKLMTPLEMKQRARLRVSKGAVKLRGIDVESLVNDWIRLSQARRNVAWKEEFIALAGEAAALAITEEQAETHSYKFVRP